MFRSNPYSHYQHQTPNMNLYTSTSYPLLNKLPSGYLSKEKGESESDEEIEESDDESDDCKKGENEDDEEQEVDPPVNNSSMNQLTIDLMINHKYLAKTNYELIQQRNELHEKMLKYKKEITKIIHDCFRHLQEGDIDPLCQNHLMDGFEQFAKQAIVDIEYSKLPEADELFC